jgi:hypothetical protein
MPARNATTESAEREGVGSRGSRLDPAAEMKRATSAGRPVAARGESLFAAPAINSPGAPGTTTGTPR